MKKLLIGIDVGSTTTKITVLDAGTETLLYSDYRRHHADQLASVLFAIREAAERFPDCDARIILTGSGAKPVAEAAGTPYIQEVVANSITLKRDEMLEPPSSSADVMRRSFLTYYPTAS